MASPEDAFNSYNHLPIHIDPSTKQVIASSSDKTVQEAVAMVNDLHNQFKNLTTPNHAPPPPIPVDPKRTANINKLRESAGQAAVKKNNAEAIRLLTFALDMASSRPDWEPSGLKREELATCYLARAASYAELREWVDAYRDALCSTECKKGPSQTPQGQRVMGNPKAFLIGGKALMEMGKTAEAVDWLEKALDIEGNQQEECKYLASMLDDAKSRLNYEV